MFDPDELLAALRAEGYAEADGGFTIDEARATHVLGKFQLDSPHRIALLLVSSAVAGGAKRFDFEYAMPSTWIARFDGDALSESELALLVPSRLDGVGGDGDGRIRDLAAAVGAACAMSLHVVIESGEMTLEAGTGTLSARAAESGFENVVTLCGEKIDGRSSTGLWSVLEGVFRRIACLVPMELRYNTVLLERGLDLRRAVACRSLGKSTADIPIRFPPHTQVAANFQGVCAVLWLSSETDCSAAVAVLNGLAFNIPVPMVAEGTQIVVFCPHARTDLSHAALVVDAPMRRVLEVLTREAVRLVLQAREAPPKLRMRWLYALPAMPDEMILEVAVAYADCALQCYARGDSRLSDALHNLAVLDAEIVNEARAGNDAAVLAEALLHFGVTSALHGAFGAEAAIREALEDGPMEIQRVGREAVALLDVIGGRVSRGCEELLDLVMTATNTKEKARLRQLYYAIGSALMRSTVDRSVKQTLVALISGRARLPQQEAAQLAYEDLVALWRALRKLTHDP